jgi:hypothetical protein
VFAGFEGALTWHDPVWHEPQWFPPVSEYTILHHFRNQLTNGGLNVPENSQPRCNTLKP